MSRTEVLKNDQQPEYGCTTINKFVKQFQVYLEPIPHGEDCSHVMVMLYKLKLNLSGHIPICSATIRKEYFNFAQSKSYNTHTHE